LSPVCVALCALLVCGAGSGCAGLHEPRSQWDTGSQSAAGTAGVPASATCCPDDSAVLAQAETTGSLQAGRPTTSWACTLRASAGDRSRSAGLESSGLYPSQIDPFVAWFAGLARFPMPIREDGTVSRRWSSRSCARQDDLGSRGGHREAYIKNGILQAGHEPSHRGPDAAAHQPCHGPSPGSRRFTSGGLGGVLATSSKRGTGQRGQPAGLMKMTADGPGRTGGLPGLDAIANPGVSTRTGNAAVVQNAREAAAGRELQQVAELCPQVIHIRRASCPASRCLSGRKTLFSKTATWSSWRPAFSNCSTRAGCCRRANTVAARLRPGRREGSCQGYKAP